MSESKEEKRELCDVQQRQLQEIHQKQVRELREAQKLQQAVTNATTIIPIAPNGGDGASDGNLLVKLLSKQLFSCADQDRAIYSARTKEWICRRCTMENDGWLGQCHVCDGFHDESDGEMWTNIEELQEVKDIQARMVLSATSQVLKDKMVLLLFGKSFSITSSNLFRAVAEWYRKGGNKVCEVVYLPDDFKEDGGFAFTHHFRLMPWYASLIRYQDEKMFPQSLEFLQLDDSIRELPSAWLFNSDGKLIGRDIQNKILNGSAFPWKSSTIIDMLQIPDYPAPMKPTLLGIPVAQAAKITLNGKAAQATFVSLSSTPPPSLSSLSSQPKETTEPAVQIEPTKLPPPYLAVYVAQMGKGKEVVKPFIEQLKKFHSKHSQLLDVMVLPADEMLGANWADEIAKMQDVLNAVYSQANVWTLTSIGDSRVRLLKDLVGVLSLPRKQQHQPSVQTLQQPQLYSNQLLQPNQQLQMLHQLLIVDRRTAHVVSRDGMRGVEQDPDALAFPWVDKWSPPTTITTTIPVPLSTTTAAIISAPPTTVSTVSTSTIMSDVEELSLENVHQFLKKPVLLCVTCQDAKNMEQREEMLVCAKTLYQDNRRNQQLAAIGTTTIVAMTADVGRHKYLLKQLAKEFLPQIETSSGKSVLDELGTGYFIFDFFARSVFFPKSIVPANAAAVPTLPTVTATSNLVPSLFVTTYLCDSKTLVSKKMPVS